MVPEHHRFSALIDPALISVAAGFSLRPSTNTQEKTVSTCRSTQSDGATPKQKKRLFRDAFILPRARSHFNALNNSPSIAQAVHLLESAIEIAGHNRAWVRRHLAGLSDSAKRDRPVTLSQHVLFGGQGSARPASIPAVTAPFFLSSTLA